MEAQEKGKIPDLTPGQEMEEYLHEASLIDLKDPPDADYMWKTENIIAALSKVDIWVG